MSCLVAAMTNDAARSFTGEEMIEIASVPRGARADATHRAMLSAPCRSLQGRLVQLDHRQRVRVVQCLANAAMRLVDGPELPRDRHEL